MEGGTISDFTLLRKNVFRRESNPKDQHGTVSIDIKVLCPF
jgi:hypothetical protein